MTTVFCPALTVQCSGMVSHVRGRNLPGVPVISGLVVAPGGGSDLR